MTVMNPRIPQGLAGTGMWEELAAATLGAGAQNIDIGGLSIGTTGTHKRFKLYFNLLNSSGGLITVNMYFNGDLVAANYNYRVQAAGGNAAFICQNNQIGNGTTWAWVLEEGQIDGINTDFWTSGYYYNRALAAVNQTVQHQWTNGGAATAITTIRLNATAAAGFGVGTEYLLLGLVQ
jgi:hypothetical protein